MPGIVGGSLTNGFFFFKPHTGAVLLRKCGYKVVCISREESGLCPTLVVAGWPEFDSRDVSLMLTVFFFFFCGQIRRVSPLPRPGGFCVEFEDKESVDAAMKLHETVCEGTEGGKNGGGGGLFGFRPCGRREHGLLYYCESMSNPIKSTRP
jgi:hypothetical protein